MKSGWYKVKKDRQSRWVIAEYVDDYEGVFVVSGSDEIVFESEMHEIGPMVMTLDGELCAGGAQHDPVFNTKQEG